MAAPSSPIHTGEDGDYPVAVPILMKGKRDDSIAFDAVAIGFSENGMGFRSNDQRLGLASLESLIRQPFVCIFNVPDLSLGEIIGRILRVEACRHDPAYLYFGAVEFLQISDLDNLMLQTGLKKYEKKPGKPAFNSPLPPPAKRV